MTQQSESLQACIDRYCRAVAEDDLPRAYRGILSALMQFKAAWEQAHPADNTGALYQGYLDMSFLAVSPAALSRQRLKISLVFLHEEGVFTLWLTAGNRAIQKSISEALQRIPLGGYSLTHLESGVDSIIAREIAKPYLFDEPIALTARLLAEAEAFAADMTALIAQLEP
jgi:hypothetical protein